MAKIIFVGSFLFVLVLLGSFGVEEAEYNPLKDLKSTIISLLKDDEILIEAQLLTGAEDKANAKKVLGCQGKYKVNDKNIILGCNDDTTFTIDGVAKKIDKKFAIFNGCIKIITRNGKSFKNIAIDNVQVRLTNGELVTIARMDPVIEKEVDGEIKKYTSKWEVKISATWK